jgi:hypothetical protein
MRILLSSKKINFNTLIFCKFSTYLRDTFDSIINKKVKDANEFEWQRCFRVYAQDEAGIY